MVMIFLFLFIVRGADAVVKSMLKIKVDLLTALSSFYFSTQDWKCFDHCPNSQTRGEPKWSRCTIAENLKKP